MNPLADRRPELDQAAGLIARAEEQAREAALFLPEEPQLAKDSATAAGKDAGQALKLLMGLGASVPHREPRASSRSPLVQLAVLEASKPEALALLDTLRHALPQAAVLDKKRGVADGADLQDTVQQLVSRLELELFGPAQSVTGGRE